MKGGGGGEGMEDGGVQCTCSYITTIIMSIDKRNWHGVKER